MSYLEITQNIQEVLDDNKQKISNKLYIELSNLNQQAYNIQSNNIYRVCYVISKPLHISECYYRTKLMKEQSLVKLSPEDYEKLTVCLEGNHCQCSNLVIQNIKEQLNIHSHEINCNTLCSDCEDCETENTVQVISEIYILSIVKD
jgi:hypothetical protein